MTDTLNLQWIEQRIDWCRRNLGVNNKGERRIHPNRHVITPEWMGLLDDAEAMFRVLAAVEGRARTAELERDALVGRHAFAERTLQAIVDFPIVEANSAGWHFAEVRALARAALADEESG